MEVKEFVKQLELQVDSKMKELVKDWTDDNKLYVYLHHIQLEYMNNFDRKLNVLMGISNDPVNQTDNSDA